MDYNGFFYIPQQCAICRQLQKKQKRLMSKLARWKSVLFKSLK